MPRQTAETVELLGETFIVIRKNRKPSTLCFQCKTCPAIRRVQYTSIGDQEAARRLLRWAEHCLAHKEPCYGGPLYAIFQ